MNALRFSSRLALLIVVLCGAMSPRGLGAQQGQGAPASDTLVAAAREIMAAAEYCSLITLDDSGRPQVRTMDPFAPDDDMVVRLGTHRKSRKVEQIRNDPRVALHYLAPEGAGYVSIEGTARLVDERSEKTRYWKDEWKEFYTDREADYVLIVVTSETLRVLEYSKGIVADPATWKVPSVEFAPGGPAD